MNTPTKLEAVTYVLPSYWASYLINGDDSGLEEGERAQINEWLHQEDLPDPVDCGESYFSWINDATDLGGDVCEYTFLIEVKA